MRSVFAIIFFAVVTTLARPAFGSSAYDALQSLTKDVSFTWARQHPITATALGISGYDAQLGSPSERARNADIALIVSWRGRLDRINSAANGHMTLVERDDVALLRAQLTGMLRQYTVYQTDRKDYGGAANAVVGAIFTQFQHLPEGGERRSAASAKAWSDITARLERAPAFITASQQIVSHPGRLFGVIGSEQLAGVSGFFNGALTSAAKAQLSARDYSRFSAARDKTLAVIAATKKYIDAHAARWPENYAIGRSAYDAMLRDEQLLSFNANDVERMGNDELAHGWALEFWLDHLSQQTGKPFGPASGGGMAPGGSALIGYYRDRIAELRNYVIANNVVTVPSWLGKIRVVETPSFLQPVSPGASMNSPRFFSTETEGYYYITPPKSLAAAAASLDRNQDFDRDRIWSTAAHEAMPGHFLQLSIARRHPDFVRRIQFSSVFAEGWAYYGEEMFVQLGLYGDDLDGPLDVAEWERVRGARAIVDPKLATGEWTYRQASDFFAKQTGFTKDQADAEMAAYALSPGDAISYTVGRNQLEMLEADYYQRMGAKGTMLDFHDRLLSYGTTPFAVVGPELLADLSKPLAVVRAAANY